MTSKADQVRFDRLREFGCICCHILGWYSVPEFHHLVDGGYRKHSGGNQSTLPICPTHHRGVVPNDLTPVERGKFRAQFGPSLSDGRKLFVARFGTERSLLARVNAEIGATESA